LDVEIVLDVSQLVNADDEGHVVDKVEDDQASQRYVHVVFEGTLGEALDPGAHLIRPHVTDKAVSNVVRREHSFDGRDKKEHQTSPKDDKRQSDGIPQQHRFSDDVEPLEGDLLLPFLVHLTPKDHIEP
jgi:hypothetical protein